MLKDIILWIKNCSKYDLEARTYCPLKRDQYITKNVGEKLLDAGYDLKVHPVSESCVPILTIWWDKAACGKAFCYANPGAVKEITLNELLNIMYGD